MVIAGLYLLKYLIAKWELTDPFYYEVAQSNYYMFSAATHRNCFYFYFVFFLPIYSSESIGGLLFSWCRSLSLLLLY